MPQLFGQRELEDVIEEPEELNDSDVLELRLEIRDPETIDALSGYSSEELRQEFAVKALRIGVMALKQARGQIDAETVRREGDRLLELMQARMEDHSKTIQTNVAGTLKDYFDPQSGRFHERVERLIRNDGELETVLRRQVGHADSELAKTLASHFGKDSELLKWLSPDETQGLLGAVRGALDEQLTRQREQVLSQFTLDNKEGALARFVAELELQHGNLTEELQGKIDQIARQFSLDDDESALSRLVLKVDRASRAITNEFSLDHEASALSRLKTMLEATNSAIEGHLSLDQETSALARLKRELLGILDTQRESSQKFQEEVKLALQAMIARKEEAARSTRHGLEFEAAVVAAVSAEAQSCGDVPEASGARVGRIKNCKVGDCIVELGPESVAPGTILVVEAKEVAGYSLKDARLEIAMARDNRSASVGLFIFSSKTAPAGLDPVRRIDGDVFVIWDAEDPGSDLFLRLGYSLARALAVRSVKETQTHAEDVIALEQAILHVEKGLSGFEELETSAQQVTRHGEKMLKRVELMRKELEKQIPVLKERTAAIKAQQGGSSV